MSANLVILDSTVVTAIFHFVISKYYIRPSFSPSVCHSVSPSVLSLTVRQPSDSQSLFSQSVVKMFLTRLFHFQSLCEMLKCIIYRNINSKLNFITSYFETDDYIELTDLIMKMSQKQLGSIIFAYILPVLFIYCNIIAI